jgi:WD40 repeat protein
LWDVQTGAQIRTFTIPTGEIGNTLVGYSPTGREILSCGNNGQDLHVWDAESGAQIRNIQGLGSCAFYAILFSSDGRRVLTPGLTDIRIWELDRGMEIRRFTRRDRVLAMAGCAALSRDGRTLATGDGFQPGAAWLWDVDPAKDNQVELGREFVAEIRKFEGHAGAVSTVSLSPDGSRLLTSGNDQTVRMWDVQTGRQIFRIEPRVSQGNMYAAAFSPDGRRFLAGGNNAIGVWALQK